MSRNSIASEYKSVNYNIAGNTRIQQIEFYAKLGFGFVPMGKKSKVPARRGWTQQTWSAKEMARHKYNIGVLPGKQSNKIICLDADENFQKLIDIDERLADTLQITRPSAPDRGKLFIRVTDILPRTTNKKHDGETKPYAELISTGKPCLVIGEHACGDTYTNNGKPIVEMSYMEVCNIWKLWTGDDLPDNPIVEKPKKKVDPDKKPNVMADTVKANWDAFGAAEYFGITKEIRIERDGQIRMMGNGGLLVTPDRELFYSFSGDHGGDCITLWGWQKFGKFELTKAEWWEVCVEMLETVGVEIPASPRSLGFDPDYVKEFITNPCNYEKGSNAQYDRSMMVALLSLMIDTKKSTVKLSSRDAGERCGIDHHTASKTLKRLVKKGWIEIVTDNGNWIEGETVVDQFVARQFDARCYKLSNNLLDEVGKYYTDKATALEAGASSTVLFLPTLNFDVYARYNGHDGFMSGSSIAGTGETTNKTSLETISVLHDNKDLSSQEVADAIGKDRSVVAKKLRTLVLVGIVEENRVGREKRYRLVDAWEEIFEALRKAMKTFGKSIKRKIAHITDRINMYRKAITDRISGVLAEKLGNICKALLKKRTELVEYYHLMMEVRKEIFEA